MAALWKYFSNFRHLTFSLKSSKVGSVRHTIRIKAAMYSTAKPYAFHPRKKTLEGKDQALYLTKTVVREELPASLVANPLENELWQELMEGYRKSITQTRLFNYEGERSTKTTCAMPLMLNMMKALWAHAERFPGLSDMSLCYKPHVSAVWKRHEDLIQVSGNLGFLLSSRKPLVNFASHIEVNDTEHQHLNNLDLIAPVFDLQQVASNSQIDTGLLPGSPYPYAQTLVIVNTEKHWSVEDRCAQGLMFTFGRLVAQAKHLYGNKIGDLLDQPLSAQCIISDGFRLSFILYQLNTLQLHDDEGVKNIAWILPGVPMYNKAVLEDNTPQNRNIYVDGFNESCFEIFTKMITNNKTY